MTFCVIYSLYSDGILVMQFIADKRRIVDTVLKNEVERRIAEGENPVRFTLTVEQYPESDRTKLYRYTEQGELQYVRTEA